MHNRHCHNNFPMLLLFMLFMDGSFMRGGDNTMFLLLIILMMQPGGIGAMEASA